jgi:hypothetical protein
VSERPPLTREEHLALMAEVRAELAKLAPEPPTAPAEAAPPPQRPRPVNPATRRYVRALEAGGFRPQPVTSGPLRPTFSRWLSVCPSCMRVEDPGLSIWDLGDGPWIECWHGCGWQAIEEALRRLLEELAA